MRIAVALIVVIPAFCQLPKPGSSGGGTGGGGTVTGVTATPPLNSSGGTAPVISGTYEGNGSKIQLFTGADPATNDCAKFDANHNVVGAGLSCGVSPSGPNTFNVRDYGALPDGTTDNYTAITAAYTAACANASSTVYGRGSTVYFPGAALTYRYQKVPQVPCSNVNTIGDGNQSILQPTYTGGTAFLVAPAVGSGTLSVPLTTALLTGSGSAMSIDATGNYLSLSDTGYSNMNGLSTWTVELTFKLNSVASDAVIISSANTSSGVFGAWSIGISSGGSFYARSNIGGTTYFLNPANVLAGTQYHTALDFSSNTLRLYLNGILIGSTTTTGVLVQPGSEQVILPGRMQRWPDDGLDANGISGAVDGVRLSNTARYTSGTYTIPTAKFSPDSNTLVLLDFDNQYGPFTVAYGQNIFDLSPLFYRSVFTGPVITTSTLNNLTFQNNTKGTGPIIFKDPNSNHSNIVVNGGYAGMLMTNNDFESSLVNYTGNAATNSQYSLALSNAAGVVHLENIRLVGGQYIFAFAGGSIDWTSGWIQTENDTVEGVHATGDGGTVFTGRGIIQDSESGAAALLYMAHFSAMDQVSLYDSTFKGIAGAPIFWFDSTPNVSVINPLLSGATGATNGITKITNTTSPVLFVNPRDTDGSPAAWSDTLNLVSLVQNGKVTNASYATNTNCSSSASPAVCGSSASGSVTVAATATTKVVNTTAITANSQVQITFDSSLGTKLGVTCNTTTVLPSVSARTAGTSFTITVGVAPITNPACFSYTIVN